MSAFDAPAPLLPEILALHGRWLGSKPALICDDEVLSWRELDQATRRIANALRQLGVARGDRVIVLMRNSLSLRAVMCCGSPLALELKRMLIERLGCDFIELYGLTEGVITTLAPEDAMRKLASVGKPLPGTDIRIVGEDDREVPRGEAGEIVSRGRIVMAGYHQRAEANAESTWLDERQRRWLRTGDIGRLDEEGFLYVVDRRKDMIISGGQNVYPADIEAVMITHAAVAEIAVIGIASRQWGETPFAVVVLQPDALLEAESLLRWTNERVGRQQRIAGVAFRDSLPRNPNGKILKRELRREYSAADQGRPG